MMTTPTYRMPPTAPEGSLTLTWTFTTADAARRWAGLLRDMVPTALHLWQGRPGWTPKWATMLRVNSRLELYQVAQVLWCEPTCDVGL